MSSTGVESLTTMFTFFVHPDSAAVLRTSLTRTSSPSKPTYADTWLRYCIIPERPMRKLQYSPG